MKHFNYYALMSAMLLTGAFGFTSCSSDDEIADGSTTTGEAVKTEFAISIPYGSSESTRMTATTVQNNSNFRGMYDISLIPFTLSSADLSNGVASDMAYSGITRLSALTNGELSATKSNKVYSDVEVPTGTNYFLFYGTGGISTNTDQTVYGKLNSTVTSSGNTSDINFTLEPITSTNIYTGTVPTAIVNLLNSLATVSATYETISSSWSVYTSTTELGKLYASFITLQSGSSNGIANTLTNLYNEVAKLCPSTDPTGTTAATDIDEAVALAICNLINNADIVSVEGNSTDGWTVTMSDNYASFPTSYNLPEGSAQLQFTSSSTTTPFSYVVSPTINAQTSTGTTSTTVVNTYSLTYPASLNYFVSTPLKATNTELESWPTNTTDWDAANVTGGTWADWAEAVSATTRTIALVKNIQYGVANLAVTVKCANSATLEDYEGNYVTIPTTSPSTTTSGFKVTGVLVGGQPKACGWDFNPTSADANDFAYTVYDNIEKSQATIDGTDYGYICAKQNASLGTNYTLVLDNLVSGSSATQNKVNIAIELENNSGAAFYGYNGGLIADGAKFYLVGQLDPEKGTISEDDKPNHVFVQDYTTTANLTISSLKNAYLTIPDLRATNMALGLSVDLNWQEGLTFDITLE
ncbi:MAG: hypothetical protein Q4D41_04050 [Prevotellaceae bacterium]|nr:hypothetical protein [Prevotellaceae bacterium]